VGHPCEAWANDMKATKPDPADPLAPELSYEGDSGESPTRLVRQILKRRSTTAEPPRDGEEDTTATVTVMLRVQPPPRALLVVDAEYRERLGHALEESGFEVSHSNSKDQALEAMAAAHHPLVMTDRLELVQRLRELKFPRLLQIILVTGGADWQAEGALRAGADEYLDGSASEALLQARLGAARRTSDLESALRTALVESRRLATTDELTGVANRRFYATHYLREIARAARYSHPISVAMCDIDHFKRINDKYGHPVGDAVLRQCAQRMQKCLRRGTDWIARLGGEEFAIVLPETGLDKGLLVCRKLREALAAEPFSSGSNRFNVTASFGIAGIENVPRKAKGLAERLMSVADRALYRSKEAGRDRVCGVRLQPAPR
jgi:diguanylate cyclase (GGDEF)-like protein